MNKREPGIKEKLDSLAKAAREELVSDFELILEHRYLIVALAATLVGIALFSNPPPPGRVVLAAGAPGSSYSAFAEKYKKFFAARGIILEVRQTQGALENARLVTDAGSDVDAAFIQAGLIDPQAAANVRSLGSLNYAPVWLFFRGSDNNGKLQKFMELGQRRIAIGPAESGSYAAAMRLLALNKQPVSRNLVVMPLAEAVAAINRNDLDAVLLVDGVDSEIIRALVRNPDLQLANFARAAAYARAVSHWQALTVPMGGLDLARNFPPQDTHIVATTTDLVVKETVHPAIQMLFLAAAQAVNGREAFFEKRHEFPSFKNDDLEESEEAKIFYKNGEPFLMRFLPFWLAEFFNRMSFYLFPLFLLSYPTIKLILDYRVKQGRIKINAVYRKLAALENQLTYSFDPFNRENYITQLNTMERTAMALRLPRELSGEYFMLRSSINYIRTCLLRGEPYIEQRHTSPRDQPDPTSLRV
ncbi:TAXI family TRAP transporter solute-binding subunit [Methylocystis sp. IM3]|uniref:TAXI family TRAP transporter solute-binding subunit n=1 Tax=Methylocystis sp. IM3 TaxID=3136722 RepID=UPI003119E23A